MTQYLRSCLVSKRMANFKAITRLFRRFDQATLMRVFGNLYHWFFDNLQINHLTLDLDSTVMTCYGQQEGAARDYNPRKPGRCLHHPLMAFVANISMIANFWLRPGNSHSANNVLSFFWMIAWLSWVTNVSPYFALSVVLVNVGFWMIWIAVACTI